MSSDKDFEKMEEQSEVAKILKSKATKEEIKISKLHSKIQSRASALNLQPNINVSLYSVERFIIII